MMKYRQLCWQRFNKQKNRSKLLIRIISLLMFWRRRLLKQRNEELMYSLLQVNTEMFLVIKFIKIGGFLRTTKTLG